MQIMQGHFSDIAQLLWAGEDRLYANRRLSMSNAEKNRVRAILYVALGNKVSHVSICQKREIQMAE